MVIYKAWEDGSAGTGSDRFAGERRYYNQDFKIVLEKKFGIMEKNSADSRQRYSW